jgi:hypothetical protein
MEIEMKFMMKIMQSRFSPHSFASPTVVVVFTERIKNKTLDKFNDLDV